MGHQPPPVSSLSLPAIRFNLAEAAGSLGGVAILLPLAMGYIAVCGINPAGLFIAFGLSNILLALYYRLPLPLEPMKVLAIMAIAEAWAPSLVFASAFAMGLFWLIIRFVGAMELLGKLTPPAVTGGICVALGILLGLQAGKMAAPDWPLAAAAGAIILWSLKKRFLPGTLLLFTLGLLVILIRGNLSAIPAPAFHLPAVGLFSPGEVWDSFLKGGLAQIPLTLANATLATAALIRTYWPDRSDMNESKLALNHGLINLLAPFIGGVPMCHGAGTLAGKHFFGARTGGSGIIEGGLQLAAGLFLAGSLVKFFEYFPKGILGVMLLFIAWELAKTASRSFRLREAAPLGATVLAGVFLNMAAGFALGVIIHYLQEFLLSRFPFPGRTGSS